MEGAAVGKDIHLFLPQLTTTPSITAAILEPLMSKACAAERVCLCACVFIHAHAFNSAPTSPTNFRLVLLPRERNGKLHSPAPNELSSLSSKTIKKNL